MGSSSLSGKAVRSGMAGCSAAARPRLPVGDFTFLDGRFLEAALADTDTTCQGILFVKWSQ